MGYSFRLTAMVLLYAPSHRQDSTYHSLCCTSRGTLAGTRNSSMGPLHEGSIRRPIAPWANALTTELHLVCVCMHACYWSRCKTDYVYTGNTLGKLEQLFIIYRKYSCQICWWFSSQLVHYICLPFFSHILC